MQKSQYHIGQAKLVLDEKRLAGVWRIADDYYVTILVVALNCTNSRVSTSDPAGETYFSCVRLLAASIGNRTSMLNLKIKGVLTFM